jgi:gliding motility-associated-like protein
MKTKVYILVLGLLTGLSFSGYGQKSSGENTGESSLDVFIPNAFTPDGNGINDSFRVVVNGPELEIYEFTVIDRNGKEVFYTTNPEEFWDGTIRGSSYTSSPSIFIYFLRVKSVEDATPSTYRGHVVLIR